MRTVLYVFTVCFVALALFAAVDEFENRPLAAALKFLLIAVAVAAIASAQTTVALTRAANDMARSFSFGWKN